MSQATTCLPCLPASNEPVAELDRGTAGASATREYERRSERHQRKEQQRVEADREWRETAKKEHPVFGWAVTAITPKAQMRPEPQHVRAWKTGAPGETRVGEVLESIPGIITLHDRKLPGSRRNIDHVAVTPAAVWVIDAKRYVDSKVEFHDAGGWFRTDERLMVGGRDRTKLVDEMSWQEEAVARAAGVELGDLPVRPALCFVEATWPWLLKRPYLVREVAICWPNALPELLSRPGPLDPASMDRIARAIAVALPAA